MNPFLPSRIRTALVDFDARLRERLGSRVHGVKLFGSWARGEARPDSDVDVWVLVDAHDQQTRHVPYEVAARVVVEHGVDVAPTVMAEAEWRHLQARDRRLARDIETQGVTP
jgi:predicted nucleotidyltransferase